MKIALYIEDGLEQIVLTPESATEKSILGKFHDGSRELSVKRGTFYGCVGGWTRWQTRSYTGYNNERDEDSTMIVLRAASGIETEGHDHEDGHGAKHESPTLEEGDAQT